MINYVYSRLTSSENNSPSRLSGAVTSAKNWFSSHFTFTPPESKPLSAVLAKREIKNKDLKADETALDQSLFWRISQKDLDATAEDKPLDLTVIVDPKDSELKFTLVENNLRQVPATNTQKAALFLPLLAATGISYNFLDEGIITSGLITAIAPFILEASSHAPVPNWVLLPGISCALYGAGFGLDYLKSEQTEESALMNLLVSVARFGFITSVALCALYYKKVGKKFATEGLAGLKSQLSGFKPKLGEGTPFYEAEIKPLSGSISTSVTLTLTLQNGEAYYGLKVGTKELPSRRMSTKSDDEEEEEENSEKVKQDKTGKDEVVASPKKANKKANSSEVVIAAKKTALIVSSGIINILSQIFIDGGQQGATTKAVNTIFTAMVKAECRQASILAGYGLPALTSLIAGVAYERSPSPITSAILSMPVGTLISIMTKDLIKDRFISGKRTKNWTLAWNEKPLFAEVILAKLGFFNPQATPSKVDPALKMALAASEEKSKATISFDAKAIHPQNESKKIKASLHISGEKLVGKYTLKKEEKKALQLVALKAEKPGMGPEAAFIGTSIALTIGSTYVTKLYLESQGVDLASQTAKPGQGVVTTILNSVSVTALKQTGKKFTVLQLHGGMTLVATSAGVADALLKSYLNSPVDFAFIPYTAELGVLSKAAKNWVYGKPYSKHKGYITKKWPTDEDLSCTKKVKDKPLVTQNV